MPKILFELPNKSQSLIEVDVTGGYYGDGEILWDERVDGPIDSNINLGAMVRVGNVLIIDPVKVREMDAVEVTQRCKGAIFYIDSSNDALVDMVIGRRDTEYLQAEMQARAYVDAGYTGDTYPYVHSWAEAKGETEQWAADNILETATAWRNIQADVRAKRLKAKEDIRNATTVSQVDAVLSQWTASIDIIKQQWGV